MYSVMLHGMYRVCVCLARLVLFVVFCVFWVCFVRMCLCALFVSLGAMSHGLLSVF